MQRLDHAVRRDVAVHRGEEGADVGRAEPPQLDVGDRVPAFEPGEQLGRRVAAGQPVGPVRAHHQQPPPAGLGQLLEHGDALEVGPVQVLEHDEPGGARREPADQLDPGADALLGRAAGVGDGLGEVGVVVGRHPAEGVEEQLHRTALAAGVGLAGQDHRVRRDPADQLLDEAGLADARLARHEGDGGVGTRADEAGQAVELGRPADHHGREPGASHEHGPSVRCRRDTGAPGHAAGWWERSTPGGAAVRTRRSMTSGGDAVDGAAGRRRARRTARARADGGGVVVQIVAALLGEGDGELGMREHVDSVRL